MSRGVGPDEASDERTTGGRRRSSGTGGGGGAGTASQPGEPTVNPSSSSTSAQYGAAAPVDPKPGMRRRSSIPNAVNASNPLYSVPASRQKNPLVVPTSTASGASLHAQVPLLYDPRSPVPRHLRPVTAGNVPIPFQATPLSTFEESDSPSASESEPPSHSNSPKIVDRDGVLAVSAKDLRRPSFHTTGATTSSPSSSKGRPLLKTIFAWTMSRKLRRVVRMWVFALVALYLTIKSLDFVLPRLRASPQVRELFEPPPPPVHDSLKEQMRQVAESVPRPSPRVEREGDRRSLGGQIAFGLNQGANEKPEQQAKLESDSSIAQFREKYLWKAPDEVVGVQFANPHKGQAHESTVIFLHGMRQKAGEAFLPVNMHKEYTSTRWVLPQANNRTVLSTENHSEIWPSWFDLALPYDPTSANGRLPHLFASVRILNQIIRAERALLIVRRREALAGQKWMSEGPRAGLAYLSSHGPDADGRRAGPVPVEAGFLEEFGTDEERRWASKRIILAGFSQGSVVSLMTALSGEYPLGGVAVFSGFLPMRWELPKLMSDLETRDVPIFWGHGSEDKILTLDDAMASVNLMRHQSLVDFFAPLKNLPANFTLPSPPASSTVFGLSDVTFRVYPMLEHSWCHDEVSDVKKWVKRLIPTGTEDHKKWT
ncbi:hypothetical protein JCM11491_002736 [Sporobolomyces phaffii]